MISIIADNIISPGGFSTIENYNRILSGESFLKPYDNLFNSGISTYASLTDEQTLNEAFESVCSKNSKLYTKIEKAALLSTQIAIDRSDIDASSKETLFVFSSTKGNVHLLEEGKNNDPRLYLWHTAKTISEHFNNKSTPITVSNACISGVCAIITAARAIENGFYKQAVVTGADMLSKFIVSGFSSFKAISEQKCKPFDKDRNGLNLGEAAATVILQKNDDKKYSKFIAGAIKNDANHISGPSRTGEGGMNALKDITQNININDIAFINAHGTSTMYNDESESIAIERAGISTAPVNAYKGNYGHTLGAAGILEIILSSMSLKNNIALKINGFENIGVSGKIQPLKENKLVDGKYFIKMISGFGGSNAAALFKKPEL